MGVEGAIINGLLVGIGFIVCSFIGWAGEWGFYVGGLMVLLSIFVGVHIIYFAVVKNDENA